MPSDIKKLIHYWNKENVITANYPLYCDYLTCKLLDSFVKNLQGKKVLDIGCGLGRMLEYFKNRGGRAYGLDLAPSAIEESRKKGFMVVTADARALPYKDNAFDLVFSLGVVEHFRETLQAIREHVRVCKKGGIVAVIVPNIITPYIPLTLLWHTFRGSLFREGLTVSCGKMYTMRRLRKYLKISGANNINILGYYGSAILKILTKNTNVKLCNLVENIFPSKFFGHLLFALAKKANPKEANL